MCSLQNCGICLDPIRGEYGILERCDHPFCLKCIKQWRNVSYSRNNQSCPTCRTLSPLVIRNRGPMTDPEHKQRVIKRIRFVCGQRTCWYWSSYGECLFGDDCPYYHPAIVTDDEREPSEIIEVSDSREDGSVSPDESVFALSDNGSDGEMTGPYADEYQPDSCSDEEFGEGEDFEDEEFSDTSVQTNDDDDDEEDDDNEDIHEIYFEESDFVISDEEGSMFSVEGDDEEELTESEMSVDDDDDESSSLSEESLEFAHETSSDETYSTTDQETDYEVISTSENDEDDFEDDYEEDDDQMRTHVLYEADIDRLYVVHGLDSQDDSDAGENFRYHNNQQRRRRPRR